MISVNLRQYFALFMRKKFNVNGKLICKLAQICKRRMGRERVITRYTTYNCHCIYRKETFYAFTEKNISQMCKIFGDQENCTFIFAQCGIRLILLNLQTFSTNFRRIENLSKFWRSQGRRLTSWILMKLFLLENLGQVISHVQRGSW